MFGMTPHDLTGPLLSFQKNGTHPSGQGISKKGMALMNIAPSSTKRRAPGNISSTGG